MDQALPKLRDLLLHGNPITDQFKDNNEAWRLEVLKRLPNLKVQPVPPCPAPPEPSAPACPAAALSPPQPLAHGTPQQRTPPQPRAGVQPRRRLRGLEPVEQPRRQPVADGEGMC